MTGKGDTPRPALPTLRTERLVLRPFDLADAPVVQALAGDREVASTTLNIPYPYTDGLAEVWIDTHRPAWEALNFMTLAATTETDGVVGAISLHLSIVHGRGELGYWIGVPFWDRGYATEAATEMLRYAFEVLGLNRVVGRHITRNPSSGRVMQKLGMKREGCLRQHFVKWGQVEDVAVYGMLRPEWYE